MKEVACVAEEGCPYPEAPFHPDEAFPELAGLPHARQGLPGSNRVYSLVRQALLELGLDDARAGTPDWNPFGTFIRPGQRVVVKPNLVLHFNKGSADISAVVTHGSVLRPVIDYAWKALEGKGEIIVGDAPHGNADFGRIVEANGLGKLIEFLREGGVAVRLVDFRKYAYPAGPSGFEKGVFLPLPGDPHGAVLVDLGEKSWLEGLPRIDRLYGSDYNRKFIVEQHTGGRHRYLITGSILQADVVISVPKMKVHKKTGVTLNIKNLVGINGDKNYLPHYRIGSPSQGGDEFPDIPSLYWRLRFHLYRLLCDVLLAPNRAGLRRIYARISWGLGKLDRAARPFAGPPRRYRNGDWSGNDTAWRMALDLYTILKFADREGRVQSEPQRRLFSLIDGIVAGESDGPMEPDAKPVGAVICGADPVLTDAFTSHLMGFDLEKLPIIRHSLPRFSGMKVQELDSAAHALVVDGRHRPFSDFSFRFKTHPEWTAAARV